MILYENNKPRYFDKHGKEITDGCTIRYADGHTEKVYLTTEGELGTDATNPRWIETGRAIPCEWGIYPLGSMETSEVEVIEPLVDLLRGVIAAEISAEAFCEETISADCIQIVSQESSADAENRASVRPIDD